MRKYKHLRNLSLKKVLRDPYGDKMIDYIFKDPQYQSNCSQTPYTLRLSVPFLLPKIFNTMNDNRLLSIRYR